MANKNITDTGILNQTGASRGFKPDSTLGNIISGVSDTAGQVLGVVDSKIKDNIEQDARYGFESLNDEFNVSSDTMPPEMLRKSKGLEKLAKAYSQGRISETYYYGRMASQLKGLRSKYSGYEKEIDSIVQNITGTRPANAYRDALFSEVKAHERQQVQGASSWQKYVDKNSYYITKAFGGAFWSDPDSFSEEKVRSAVAQAEFSEKSVDAQNTQLSLMSKQNTLTEEQFKETASSVFSQEVGAALTSIDNGMGFDSKKTMSLIRDISTGKTEFDPEQVVQLSQNIAMNKQATKQRLLEVARKGDYYKLGKSSSEVNQMIEESLAPFDSLQSLIDNKDFGLATIMLRKNNISKESVVNNLIQNPTVRNVLAISEVSPAAGEYLFNTEYGIAGEELLKEISASAALGNIKLDKQISEIASTTNSAEEKGEAINVLINDQIGIIESGSATESEVKNLINSFHGDYSSEGNIFKQIQPSEYKQLFGKLFSPTVTEQVKRLGQEEQKLYFDSAMDRFMSIPEFRTAANTLSQDVDFSKFTNVNISNGRLNVTIDEGRFESSGIQSVDSIRVLREGWSTQRLKESTEVLNSALAQMTPILETQGLSPEQGIALLLDGLSTNLNKDNTPDMFSFIGDKVKGLVGLGDTDGTEAASLDDDTSIDFLPPSLEKNVLTAFQSDVAKAIDIGETGGTGDYDTLLGFSQKEGKSFSGTKITEQTVDELLEFSSPKGDYGKFSKKEVGRVATPMGRYQIVGKTLRSLKSKLGLTGKEKFTPELQDRLFSELLRGRGYDDYIRGDLSKEAFIKNLQKEWEGLELNQASLDKLNSVV